VCRGLSGIERGRICRLRIAAGIGAMGHLVRWNRQWDRQTARQLERHNIETGKSRRRQRRRQRVAAAADGRQKSTEGGEEDICLSIDRFRED